MRFPTIASLAVAATLVTATTPAHAQWRGHGGGGFAFHPGFGGAFHPGFRPGFGGGYRPGFRPGFAGSFYPGFRGPCCYNNWWIPGAVLGGLALGAAILAPPPPPVVYAPPAG